MSEYVREGDDCAQVHMSGDSQRPANSLLQLPPRHRGRNVGVTYLP